MSWRSRGVILILAITLISIFLVFFSIIRDLVAELPFILMHPKPEEEVSAGISPIHRPNKDSTANVAIDQNLIQLDAYVVDVGVIHFTYSLFR